MRRKASDAKALMRRGGFNLCKFVTNHAPLQERIEVAENTFARDSSHHETYAQRTLGQPKDNSSEVKKVLRVFWDTVNDELLFEFNYLFDHIIYAEPTKRQVVSTVGRFYDPLGFIQPVIIRYKVFIQELCRRKVMWDEPLEGVLLERWQLLARSLRDCQPVRIPRCYTLPHANSVGSYHLYGFCDASTTTYAAVVYLVLRNGSEHSAKLVACKTMQEVIFHSMIMHFTSS